MARVRSSAASLCLGLAMSVTACTGDVPGDTPSPGAAPAGTISEAAATTFIGRPSPAGSGSLAGSPPQGMVPSRTPAQAGEELAGRALPTNQWWTSALSGPLSQPIWAHPLAVRTTAGGLQVSSAPPAASANAVVTPFVPAVTAGGPVTSLRVVGYGAFHVVLRAQLRQGGSVEATLVQGSPVLHLRFRDTAPALAVSGGSPSLDDGGSRLRLDIAGQRWDVLAADGARWTREGKQIKATGARDGQVALARVPDGADTPAWEALTAGADANPVVETTTRMSYDGSSGAVVQTLAARRIAGGSAVWALLPHQRTGLVTGAGVAALRGTFPDARGPLSLVSADTVRIRVPLPGLLTAVPSAPLSSAARTAIVQDLNRDLSDEPGTGGSYFGLKELGRLATVAEVAQAVDATGQRQRALSRLRSQLVDWLTYEGDQDQRYFAYDETWGGLIAVPAEFGSQDYNDHHFQYGYLVRAAAVLAQADPAFLRDYGPTVDLVVRDFSGTLSGEGPDGFPAFRSFNAYLGHSAASGYAAFADGNNQESSSEAVAAWEAVTRWGVVRGDDELTTYGMTHYAMEAATARMYWLGEGLQRPAGYAHRTAGIVWDAKIDYATWFDPRPESIQGIQLLPLTVGSLYRADPRAAKERAAQLATAAGGPPRVWRDLFTADLALADPVAARDRLTADAPREESTSRAIVRYWVELLAAVGPPQPAVVADGPYGMAFGSRDRPTLLTVNPSARDRTVTFRTEGDPTTSVALGPRQSVSRKR